MTQSPWYDDRDLVRSLPALFRVYAAYSRVAGDRRTRRVAGGSFLLHVVQRVSAFLGFERHVRLRATPTLAVWIDVGDERLLDVFYEARSQNPEQALLLSVLKDGDTFIDVGANYGTFALVAAQIVGPSGKVIAIEPQPRLAELIRRSAEANGFTNLEVLQIAVDARSGETDFYVPAHDTGRAGLIQKFSAAGAHNTVRVRTATLDEAIALRSLPGNLVVKIDVEGSECDVIDGGSRLLSERRPVVIVELNPWSAKAAGKTTDAIINSLRDNGYDSFAPVGADARASTSPVASDRQQNIVATIGVTTQPGDRILTVSCAE